MHELTPQHLVKDGTPAESGTPQAVPVLHAACPICREGGKLCLVRSSQAFRDDEVVGTHVVVTIDLLCLRCDHCWHVDLFNEEGAGGELYICHQPTDSPALEAAKWEAEQCLPKPRLTPPPSRLQLWAEAAKKDVRKEEREGVAAFVTAYRQRQQEKSHA